METDEGEKVHRELCYLLYCVTDREAYGDIARVPLFVMVGGGEEVGVCVGEDEEKYLGTGRKLN